MHKIEKVLAPDDLQRIGALIKGCRFSDGGASARGAAQQVKANEQLELAPEQHAALAEIVFAALRRSRDFNRTALPVELSSLMINRYATGMSYGAHFDRSFMPAPNGKQIRADLSATLFLSPAGDYDGGELCVARSSGEERVKLNAGDLFLYPACTLHSVAEVARGERLAIIFWVQSMIRDHEKRALVSDLDGVVGSLAQRLPGSTEVRDLSAVVNSLTRIWGELGMAATIACGAAALHTEMGETAIAESSSRARIVARARRPK
jgi:PKHD-type hydroxylase